jgi:transposase-like protein
VQIRGKWFCLYRAVDKEGRTIDLLLRPDRGIAAVQAFLRKAVATNHARGPPEVTLDGHVPGRWALWLLRRDAQFWRHVEVRTNRDLNNIVEQDHRVVERRCSVMHGFKSVQAATVAIGGRLSARIGSKSVSSGWVGPAVVGATQ